MNGWIIFTLIILILATLGFYILIYYRFMAFINQDKDRINTFRDVCYKSLLETNSDEIEENINDDSLIESSDSLIETSIDDEF